jgi:hypothetical protein
MSEIRSDSANITQAYRSPPYYISRGRVAENMGNKFYWKYA